MIAVQRTAKIRASGLAYKNSPKLRNIDRPIQISITMPTAVATLKALITSRPDMVVDVASLAGVGRWHSNQLNACLNRFVSQKQPQLVERPTIRSSTFGLGSGLPLRAFPDSPLDWHSTQNERECPDKPSFELWSYWLSLVWPVHWHSYSHPQMLSAKHPFWRFAQKLVQACKQWVET